MAYTDDMIMMVQDEDKMRRYDIMEKLAEYLELNTNEIIKFEIK